MIEMNYIYKITFWNNKQYLEDFSNFPWEIFLPQKPA